MRAKSRVDKIRGFYTHLGIFIVINIGITVVKVVVQMRYGSTLDEAFMRFETWAAWLLWGIGLALHAFGVFGLPKIMGNNWEADKIQEFMDEEERRKN